MTADTLYCEDAAKALTWLGLPDPGCCDSCHEDWNSGFDDPLEDTLPDGRVLRTCCAYTRDGISVALAKQAKDWSALDVDPVADIRAHMAALRSHPPFRESVVVLLPDAMDPSVAFRAGHVVYLHWTMVPPTAEQVALWRSETPAQGARRIVNEVLEHYGYDPLEETP